MPDPNLTPAQADIIAAAYRIVHADLTARADAAYAAIKAGKRIAGGYIYLDSVREARKIVARESGIRDLGMFDGK